MIDILQIKKCFKKYISNYDVNEPRINLKIIHMYHVAENAKKIAQFIGLSKEDQDLAELIGLLHDIGRFEQIRLYGTFSDKFSIDHGQKSVEVLFGDNLIRDFVQDSTNDSIIYKAINNHNKIEIEKGLNEKEMLHSKIIRDADNLDIFRGLLEQKIEDFGHLGSTDVSKEILSEEFFEQFKKEKILKYANAKTDMDIMVAIIAHIYAISFKETLEIIKENNYIDKFVKRLDCKDRYTRSKMNEIVSYSMEYINRKIES